MKNMARGGGGAFVPPSSKCTVGIHKGGGRALMHAE